MSLQFVDGIIKTPNLNFDEKCGGVGNIYFNSLKKYSDKVAVINTSTEEFYTYSDLLEKCVRMALVLQKQGFKKQDVIAICSNKENLDANIPLIVGQFLGLITFSLDPQLSVDECVELIQQVEPKIIFVIEKAKEMVTKSLNTINVKTEIVLFGDEFNESFLAKQEYEDSFEPVFIENLQDTCAIHFSSGSTGLPKPICLSHYYFMAVISTPNYFTSKKNIQQDIGKSLRLVTLRFTNWYWVTSSFELFIYTFIGGCRLLRDRFDANELWKLIEKYSVTNLGLTPLQCIDLLKTTKPKKVNLSSLIDISTSGYVLHQDYILQLRSLFPGTYIYQGYGMTECGGVTTFNIRIPKHLQLLKEKPSSCGLPIPGLYYKVIDLETGLKCGPNQPGELYLKGKALFNGFYNKDASESFDDEGFFYTGDLVYFDEDFCFYILDRIKSVLGWNDWLIYPYHIEKVLLEHPSVHNAVVIGIPHRIEGERLMGVVILKENGPKVTENDLVAYVDGKVEDHKRLREGIKFIKEFPLTITGKISRLKIKEMVLNNLIS